MPHWEFNAFVLAVKKEEAIDKLTDLALKSDPESEAFRSAVKHLRSVAGIKRESSSGDWTLAIAAEIQRSGR